MAYDNRALVGVGGWLAFFVITLAVLSPLGTIAALFGNLYANPAVAQAYGARWPLVQTIEWTITAAVVAGSWFMAWRLMRVHTPATLRIVRIGLPLCFLLPALLETAVIAVLIGQPFATMFAAVLPQLIRPVVYVVVWSLYLARSERVANTYTPDTDPLEAVFE